MEGSGKMWVGFSVILERVDRNFKDEIKKTNDKLKMYCECSGFINVVNNSINKNSLNKSFI